jgi:integrase
LLLTQGVPARVVQDVLGHSQVTLTLGTYSHVMPAMLQESADAMERAFGTGR